MLRDVLASAFAELLPYYRTAITLRVVEGLSVAEVAEAVRIAVGTAKTRVHRARLLLRNVSRPSWRAAALPSTALLERTTRKLRTLGTRLAISASEEVTTVVIGDR